MDDGTTVTSYGYQAVSNRLISIDAAPIQRDLSGNRIADVGGTRTYTYNNANRLAAVLDGGLTTATYVHNALGQRTKKTVGTSDVIYLYDLAGNLLAEHDATGAMIRDYVWMNDAPVAQIDSGEAFRYLHFDHLNTPRLATDDAQTVVWRWDSDAFGTTLADEDPDGDLSATTVNLRFPGQYFDQETGFHYNYFRTYDPSIGRYVESDPIGLYGGLNTYGYANQNATKYIDPTGESGMLVGLSRVTGNPKPGLVPRVSPVSEAVKQALMCRNGSPLPAQAQRLTQDLGMKPRLRPDQMIPNTQVPEAVHPKPVPPKDTWFGVVARLIQKLNQMGMSAAGATGSNPGLSEDHHAILRSLTAAEVAAIINEQVLNHVEQSCGSCEI